MGKFSYKAWDSSLKVLKGVIEEEDLEGAKEKLRTQGLKVIDIYQSTSLKNIELGSKKLKDMELANFCEQMGIILNSGVNMLRGLEILKAQAKNKKMQTVLEDVHSGVRKGQTLARSMEGSAAFPKLLCDMVNSGELSGNVDTIFFNMENFYEREARIKEKVTTASVYPLMLLFTAIGMIVFFNFFVFSELKELFADNDNLPWITKALIGSMEFMNENFILMIVLIVVLIIFLKYLTTVKEVAVWMDRIALSIPIVKGVKMDMIVARFTRSMALFLKSAVPVLSILDSLQTIVDNLYIGTKIEGIKTEMINGSSIADALEKQKIFEPLVVQMTRVGEETGKLEESLDKLAEIYDKKVESGISRLMAMIEPTFTLIVGLFVGILMLAMAMPVMNMTDTLR
jgi:type IV pilus assembly protein PilC